MPVRTTTLKVRKADKHIIYINELPWWDFYSFCKHPLIKWTYDNEHIDGVTRLTLAEFVEVNRSQIQGMRAHLALEYGPQIQEITKLIRGGSWDDATLEIINSEWESGYDW